MNNKCLLSVVVTRPCATAWQGPTISGRFSGDALPSEQGFLVTLASLGLISFALLFPIGQLIPHRGARSMRLRAGARDPAYTV